MLNFSTFGFGQCDGCFRLSDYLGEHNHSFDSDVLFRLALCANGEEFCLTYKGKYYTKFYDEIFIFPSFPTKKEYTSEHQNFEKILNSYTTKYPEIRIVRSKEKDILNSKKRATGYVYWYEIVKIFVPSSISKDMLNNVYLNKGIKFQQRITSNHMGLVSKMFEYTGFWENNDFIIKESEIKSADYMHGRISFSEYGMANLKSIMQEYGLALVLKDELKKRFNIDYVIRDFSFGGSPCIGLIRNEQPKPKEW